jgi:ABC-type hemin transport system ATPase subunit
MPAFTWNHTGLGACKKKLYVIAALHALNVSAMYSADLLACVTEWRTPRRSEAKKQAKKIEYLHRFDSQKGCWIAHVSAPGRVGEE